MLMRTLYRVAAVGALILMPMSVLAQFVVPQVGGTPTGWIGIRLEVRNQTSSDGVRSVVVVVTDLVDAGPARAAGLRTGDLILRINDIDDARGFQNVSDRLHLDAGDPVQIVYVRGGQRHQLDLTAADRPRPASAPVDTFRIQSDSMVETAFRAMSSIKVRLVQARGRNVPLPDVSIVPPAVSVSRVAEPTRPDPRWLFPRSGESVQTWVTQGVRAPFPFLIFPGEQHDSLQRAMDELNGMLREVAAREGERVRDLMRISGTLRGNEDDRQLVQIRAIMEDLSQRTLQVRKSMEEATVSNAGNRYNLAFPPRRVREIDREREIEREQRVEFRPLMPYLIGQNRAVGAEVIDLRPELAAFFEVDGGVLVTDVPNETPAAAAGIRPGDVITRVDGIAVRSVLGLRLALSQADSTIRLTLVRRGETTTVLLRR
jgi:predicted metalloprotease with PDZ domain